MAKKPDPVPPSWVGSPPGWFVRIETRPPYWRDLPVLGWDSGGPFSWWNGAGVRPVALVDVFHETTTYRHRGEYLRS